MAELLRHVQTAFPRRKILVAGDIVADQFLNGTISRVSREAPVFILRHDETETRPGGAANAAANIAALGGTPQLVGIAGKDASGTALKNAMEASSVDIGSIVTGDEIATTTKIRVLAGQHYAARQQVIRIDYENETGLSADVVTRFEEAFARAAADAEAIVLSDYGYGAITDDIFVKAKQISGERNIPLLVDSRFGLEKFAGATAATPNQDEAEQILGKDFTPQDCESLRKRLGLRALLITRGNKGMLLLEEARPPLEIAAVGPTQPLDVTGAGDTVIAAFSLGLASGLGFAASARIANHAGGIVVMKKGTATATLDEVVRSIAGEKFETSEAAG